MTAINDSSKKTPVSLRVLDGKTELVEEEFEQIANFFSKWSREIVITLLIVGALTYGITSYRTAQERSLKGGSEQVTIVRTAYEDLKNYFDQEKNNPEELKQAETKLKEALKVLGDTKEPYKNFVPLYTVLGATLVENKEVIEKSYNEAKGSLQTVKEFTKDSIPYELELFAVARSMLDIPNLESSGIDLLFSLAQKGYITRAQAINTLELISEQFNDEQKKRLADARVGLEKERPELLELVKQ